MYGPTETTVWSTVRQVKHAEDFIPLGEPIDNTTLCILDAALQPVPDGAAGELHIGGAGLARGYRNRLDLTAERFIESPFARGERLYKTGDLCRYRGNSGIQFLGRLDDQVKLHGHRIELGEIESVLLRHPSVQQAAVVINERPGPAKRLVAYLVRPANIPAAADAALRDFLVVELPQYMLPSAFIYLDALPLTPNGKIDRRALAALEVVSTSTPRGRDYFAPHTPAEIAIAALWSEILKTPRIGLHDRFDELGGDSLSFALMTVRAGHRLGAKIPVRMDAETLSLAGFARFAAGFQGEETAEAPPIRRDPMAKTFLGGLLVKTCSFIVRCLTRVEVQGLENLPERGPAIFAGNHISLFDLVILGSAVWRLNVRAAVTPTFLIFEKWRWLAHPYASQFGHAIYIRRGEADLDALAAAREVLAAGGALAIAPEGRPTRGALTRAKPGVAHLARETGAPIWPLAIFGHDRAFSFWKRFRRVPVQIRLGAKLLPRQLGGPGLQGQADAVMQSIAALMPPEYRGAYSGVDSGRGQIRQ